MEGPGFGIGTDATILHGGYLYCSARMNYALSISVEERQVKRFVELRCPHIGDERTRVINEIGSPGTSPHHGGIGRTSVCAQYPEVREQAEAAEDPASND